MGIEGINLRIILMVRNDASLRKMFLRSLCLCNFSFKHIQIGILNLNRAVKIKVDIERAEDHF